MGTVGIIISILVLALIGRVVLSVIGGVIRIGCLALIGTVAVIIIAKGC